MPDILASKRPYKVFESGGGEDALTFMVSTLAPPQHPVALCGGDREFADALCSLLNFHHPILPHPVAERLFSIIGAYRDEWKPSAVSALQEVDDQIRGLSYPHKEADISIDRELELLRKIETLVIQRYEHRQTMAAIMGQEPFGFFRWAGSESGGSWEQVPPELQNEPDVIAAYQREAQERLGATVVGTAYLIEKTQAFLTKELAPDGRYFAWRGDTLGGRPRFKWTDDVHKAARFSTRAEAKAHTNDDPSLIVVEHRFGIGGER